MLAGRRPFQAEHHRPDVLWQAICEREPVRPSATCGRLRQLLAGDLDNIVATAMRKNSAQRYANVAQFSEDIRRHTVGLPVTARPDTFTYRAGKFVRRKRVAVALVGLVALTLVPG